VVKGEISCNLRSVGVFMLTVEVLRIKIPGHFTVKDPYKSCVYWFLGEKPEDFRNPIFVWMPHLYCPGFLLSQSLDHDGNNYEDLLNL